VGETITQGCVKKVLRGVHHENCLQGQRKGPDLFEAVIMVIASTRSFERQTGRLSVLLPKCLLESPTDASGNDML